MPWCVRFPRRAMPVSSIRRGRATPPTAARGLPPPFPPWQCDDAHDDAYCQVTIPDTNSSTPYTYACAKSGSLSFAVHSLALHPGRARKRCGGNCTNVASADSTCSKSPTLCERSVNEEQCNASSMCQWRKNPPPTPPPKPNWPSSLTFSCTMTTEDECLATPCCNWFPFSPIPSIQSSSWPQRSRTPCVSLA